MSKFGENGSGWQLWTDGTSPTYLCRTIRNNNAGTVTLGAAVYGNPEFAFGHGLSYTKFDFKNGKLESKKKFPLRHGEEHGQA